MLSQSAWDAIAVTKIIRPVHAYVDEVVRITWTKRYAAGPMSDPREVVEFLTEDHTAPPPDVWNARLKEPTP